jgi:hypothetical protein
MRQLRSARDRPLLQRDKGENVEPAFSSVVCRDAHSEGPKRHLLIDFFAQPRGGAENRRGPLRSVLCDGEFKAFQCLRRGIRIRQVIGDREAFDEPCFGGLQVPVSAFGTTPGTGHRALTRLATPQVSRPACSSNAKRTASSKDIARPSFQA